MKKKLLFLLPFLLLSLSACQKKEEHQTDTNTDTITETDTGSETSTDTETSTETGSETETTTETETETETTTDTDTGGYTPSDEKGLDGDPIKTDEVAQEYYKDISASLIGTELATKLSALVNKNRCTTGYDSLWGYYPYCDADPDNPTSGKIIAFYRGTPENKGAMNKEHVWPDSRGGNLVEGDPHMTRPTLSSDNSSRGNSFYVEGKSSSQDGWDPKADGMNENFRGDSARIIFYAAIAKYGQLGLVDKTNDSTGNHTMGKLSDLIKWNFEYPISKFEKFRNEVLSGERSVNGSNYRFNRNPFIDDRTLPCKIWGDTNSETQRLCAMYTKKVAPTSLTLNKSALTLEHDETFKLEISNATPVDATRSVAWKSLDTSVATVNQEGLVTGVKDGNTQIVATSTLDTNVTVTCDVTVKTTDKPLQGVNVNASMTLSKGSSNQLNVTFNPSNAYPIPSVTFKSNDTSVATVDENGKVSAVNTGSTQIEVKAVQNDITKYGYCQVTVTDKAMFTKISGTQSNWAGKYLIVNDNAKKAFNSSASPIDKNNAVDVTITNGQIEATSALMNALVEVVQVGSEYIMKTSTGLTIIGGNKSISAVADDTTRSTFVYSNGNVTINSGNSYTLQYNGSASVFRYYSSAQSPVTMYKL